MPTPIQVQPGPQKSSDGVPNIARGARTGEMVVSENHGQWYEAASRGKLFMAHAIVTAPVIYTTAAGTGGPILHNKGTGINCSILAIGFGVTVVTTVAAALGLTGGANQTAAMGSTTAIDSTSNMLIGGPPSQALTYRVATPAAAGSFFLPFAALHTGALTVDTEGVQWFNINGGLVVPPNGWCSVAASATATTTVASISMIWEEIDIT